MEPATAIPESSTHESAPSSGMRPAVEDAYGEINRLSRQRILGLKPEEVVLFLPHCLRSRHCPAPSDEEGLHCRKCGLCVIATFLEAAESRGVKVFCVPGGSVLERLMERYRPKGVLGVACGKEIELGLRLQGAAGLLFQVFPLDREGCFETNVDPQGILSVIAAWAPLEESPKEEGEEKSLAGIISWNQLE